MEEFKLEYFKKDFPQKDIFIEKIEENQIDSILKKLFISNHDSLENLLNTIDSDIYTVDSNLEEKNNFKELFESSISSIRSSEEKVYIYNMNFNKMDLIDLHNLIDNFDYFWYPSSDDVLLFDESFSWLVYVSHYGRTVVYNLEQ